MSRTIVTRCDVEIPRVPNFLLYGTNDKISIADVSDKSLREIGRQWTQRLLKRAEAIRAARGQPGRPV